MPKDVSVSQALNDYATGNVSLAKAEFTQITKSDPQNKYAWYDLGVIAQGAGDSGTAGSDYQKAIAIDPAFESALYNYGVLRFQANDIANAINYFDKATQVTPNDANALWDLGLALARKDDKAANKRATAVLNRALRIDPTLVKSLGAVPKVATGGSGATSGSGAKPSSSNPAKAGGKAATSTSAP